MSGSKSVTEMKLNLFAPVDFNGASDPVQNPIFADAPAGIEFQRGFTVPPLIVRAGRMNFDHEFGRSVKLAIGLE